MKSAERLLKKLFMERASRAWDRFIEAKNTHGGKVEMSKHKSEHDTWDKAASLVQEYLIEEEE